MLEDERARELIALAERAAQAGTTADARGILQRALATSPSMGLRIQAWRILARLSEEPADKRQYLQSILLADPTDGLARRDLAVLSGALDVRDIVDPDQDDPRRPSEDAHEVDAVPLTCLSCGAGRLTYSPEARALVCSHCGARQQVDATAATRAAASAGGDFAAAMWTAKARRTPTRQPIVACSRCGASFVARPGAMAVQCFYCGTETALQQSETHDLLAPDGIVPWAVTREAARERLEEAGAGAQRDVSGGYVPVWLFRFAGEVGWTGIARQQFGDSDRQPETITGTYTVIELIVPVFGTSRLHEAGDVGAPQADFSRVLPFDPEYLAGWPTETYNITLEEAAVAARSVAVERARGEVLENTEDEAVRVEIRTGSLGIDTFRLLLAPVWVAPASVDGPSLLLDGCTGHLYERRRPGLFDRLRRGLGIE